MDFATGDAGRFGIAVKVSGSISYSSSVSMNMYGSFGMPDITVCLIL